MMSFVELEWSETLNFFIRFMGRVGFCLLILSIYRVYKVFASPLVKLRHQKFVRSFAVTVVFSFVLFGVNYLYPTDWLSNITMAFNVLTMYILTLYLYQQGSDLHATRGSTEYQELSRAMDALILRLKHK